MNITSAVMKAILEDVSSPYERIGLLLGAMSDDGLWVTDLVSGGADLDGSHASFPNEKLAEVADDIMQGKLQGSIVGWYHSHVGHGLFMSQIDVDTQRRLLQFSPYVIALVIEATTRDFALWAYEPNEGLIRLPPTQVRIV